jgi:hypothetical protein
MFLNVDMFVRTTLRRVYWFLWTNAFSFRVKNSKLETLLGSDNLTGSKGGGNQEKAWNLIPLYLELKQFLCQSYNISEVLFR